MLSQSEINFLNPKHCNPQVMMEGCGDGIAGGFGDDEFSAADQPDTQFYLYTPTGVYKFNRGWRIWIWDDISSTTGQKQGGQTGKKAKPQRLRPNIHQNFK